MTDAASGRFTGYRSVLFDLDGTLIDTAPDMVEVLNAMQTDRGVEPVPYDKARSNVSNGALGLIRLAFPGLDASAERRLHVEYLERYEQTVCVRSRIFPGLGELLEHLDAVSAPWGVVTNKPQRMTEPLLEALGLSGRSGCVVSGDTLPQKKPHPAPLLLASELIEVEPDRTIYVGDAARDIEAGRAAGMGTVAAAYGYVTDGDDPLAWNADELARDTLELSRILLNAVNVDV